MERENPARDMAKLVMAPILAILLILVGLIEILIDGVGRRISC